MPVITAATVHVPAVANTSSSGEFDSINGDFLARRKIMKFAPS